MLSNATLEMCSIERDGDDCDKDEDSDDEGDKDAFIMIICLTAQHSS